VNDIEISTPEPREVYLSYSRCPIHNFYFISTPRDKGTGIPTIFKCPLKNCSESSTVSQPEMAMPE
jgi:hypothetical protein